MFHPPPPPPTQQLAFYLFVLMKLIASIITFSKKKLEKKMLPSTWHPRPRHGTLDKKIDSEQTPQDKHQALKAQPYMHKLSWVQAVKFIQWFGLPVGTLTTWPFFSPPRWIFSAPGESHSQIHPSGHQHALITQTSEFGCFPIIWQMKINNHAIST